MMGGATPFVPQKGFKPMAKKADLLEQAKTLGLEVSDKNTVAEIEAAIATAGAVDAEAEIAVEEKKAAKAGKRSEKSLREAEEQAEKEARKEAGDTSAQSDDGEVRSTKGPRPTVRPRSERRGKNYRKVAGLVEKEKVYGVAEALELATKTNPAKFDASVEVHVRLGVDPRQADQNIRTTVSLPNGTGKTVRVAVFAPEAEHAGAKKAGADIVGDEDFLKQLDKEELNFDILIATPQYMPKLGKYARLLGPRGLMPNPKSGTVSTDVTKAVTEAKAGKVEYRVDKQAIVHLSIGKVSFGAAKLEENARAFFASLQSQKPSSLKGAYVKTTSISTTQGPSIKIESIVN
jgi:large subunit ribosomal protein L1